MPQVGRPGRSRVPVVKSSPSTSSNSTSRIMTPSTSSSSTSRISTPEHTDVETDGLSAEENMQEQEDDKSDGMSTFRRFEASIIKKASCKHIDLKNFRHTPQSWMLKKTKSFSEEDPWDWIQNALEHAYYAVWKAKGYENPVALANWNFIIGKVKFPSFNSVSRLNIRNTEIRINTDLIHYMTRSWMMDSKVGWTTAIMYDQTDFDYCLHEHPDCNRCGQQRDGGCHDFGHDYHTRFPRSDMGKGSLPGSRFRPIERGIWFSHDLEGRWVVVDFVLRHNGEHHKYGRPSILSPYLLEQDIPYIRECLEEKSAYPFWMPLGEAKWDTMKYQIRPMAHGDNIADTGIFAVEMARRAVLGLEQYALEDAAQRQQIGLRFRYKTLIDIYETLTHKKVDPKRLAQALAFAQ